MTITLEQLKETIDSDIEALKVGAVNLCESNVMLEETASLQKRCKELEDIIHIALGYIEHDCESECIQTLQRSGISGHSFLVDCEWCGSKYRAPVLYDNGEVFV